MTEPKDIPKSQAPIFRRAALTPSPGLNLPPRRSAEYAQVTPLGIFVARRRIFDAIVRDRAIPSLVLEILFRKLPLEAMGWHADSAIAARLGTSEDGFPIWRVSSTANELSN